MYKTDAIVFIKRDSERLPGKNFLNFNGRPLYTVILQTLEQHPAIDRILVDTDTDEVRVYVEKGISKGVAIKRPPYLQGGHISANQLITYDLSFSKNNHFFQTHCTNPLLTPATIGRALNRYYEMLDIYDSMFSVIKIQNRFFDEYGNPTNHLKGEVQRLQDLKPVFMENASFFIFSKESFAAASNDRIGLRPGLFPISSIEGTDIDYEADFILAELLQRNTHLFPGIFTGAGTNQSGPGNA